MTTDFTQSILPIICVKCGHKSGLWVLQEIVNKTYAENMKKIMSAVWELPAK
jgi:hypothetical protein